MSIYRQRAEREAQVHVPDYEARAQQSEAQRRRRTRWLTVTAVVVLALGGALLTWPSALHGLGPWLIGTMFALAVIVDVVRARL
jgi:uncharacterized membrane protein HdeD (DUF308 family)